MNGFVETGIWDKIGYLIPTKYSIERPDTYPNSELDPNNLKEIAAGLHMKTLALRTSHWVYIIKCEKPKHWYVGCTSDLDHRLSVHKQGNSAKFVREHGYDRLWATFEVDCLEQAEILEKATHLILNQVYPIFCISMGRPCSCV